MLLKIFTVHDSKAEAFLQPFFAQTTGLAVRMFEEAANDETHQFSKYRGDYTLFELGSFDQDNARFDQLSTPLNLGLALTYVRLQNDIHPVDDRPDLALATEKPTFQRTESN